MPLCTHLHPTNPRTLLSLLFPIPRPQNHHFSSQVQDQICSLLPHFLWLTGESPWEPQNPVMIAPNSVNLLSLKMINFFPVLVTAGVLGLVENRLW